ncbi:hypothetical protein HK100_001010 [Physocladia obscura]|uniref:Uncharacterized protein n=1 Tax=Physocladia obscura TaxID=109957 RepID=A0AAD5XF62_9FUNG|nr:hypothetical protein HK100_001010 [Physocladia obscura]
METLATINRGITYSGAIDSWVTASTTANASTSASASHSSTLPAVSSLSLSSASAATTTAKEKGQSTPEAKSTSSKSESMPQPMSIFSPLYPHMERMSLRAAVASSNFALDAADADVDASAPSSTHTTASTTTPTPTTSSTPALLLFNSAPSAKSPASSLLKFPSPTTPSNTPLILVNSAAAVVTRKKQPNSTISVKTKRNKNKSDSLNNDNVNHDLGNDNDNNLPENNDDADDDDNDEPVKMDEDTDEILNALDSSLVGKKGTADEKKFPCTEPDCSATFAQSHIQKVHERPQIIRRPRANSSTSIAKQSKGSTKSNAIGANGSNFPGIRPRNSSISSSVGSGATSAATQYMGSFLLDRYYTPSLVSRPRAGSLSVAFGGFSVGGDGVVADENGSGEMKIKNSSGESNYRDRLSASLMTPPPSDWSVFDRDGDWLMNGFVDNVDDSDDDDDEEEDVEESDEDEFDNFEEDEDEEDDGAGDAFVDGNENECAKPNSEGTPLDSVSFGVDADASRLLMYMRETSQGRDSDTSISFYDGGFGVRQESATGSLLNSSSLLHGGTSIGAASLGSSFQNEFASLGSSFQNHHILQHNLSHHHSHHNHNHHSEGPPVGMTTPLSQSLRTVGMNSGVKKRKGKQQLPLAAATQVKLRGRSMSLGKEAQSYDDGLQFIIDGFEPVDQQHEHQEVSAALELGSHLMLGAEGGGKAAEGEDYNEDEDEEDENEDEEEEEEEEGWKRKKGVGKLIDDEEAARVLASVSFEGVVGVVGAAAAGVEGDFTNIRSSSSSSLFSSSSSVMNSLSATNSVVSDGGNLLFAFENTNNSNIANGTIISGGAGLLPLLATAAARSAITDAIVINNSNSSSDSYSGGGGGGSHSLHSSSSHMSLRNRHPPVTFSSSQSLPKSHYGGGVSGGVSRSIGGGVGGSGGGVIVGAKSFERNVMTQFVDAVAKRASKGV